MGIEISTMVGSYAWMCGTTRDLGCRVDWALPRDFLLTRRTVGLASRGHKYAFSPDG